MPGRIYDVTNLKVTRGSGRTHYFDCDVSREEGPTPIRLSIDFVLTTPTGRKVVLRGATLDRHRHAKKRLLLPKVSAAWPAGTYSVVARTPQGQTRGTSQPTTFRYEG